ncbi:hypothetical protein K170097C1_32080 [Hungatella effluvii]
MGLIDHGRPVRKTVFHADDIEHHHKEDAYGYVDGKQARFSFQDVMLVQK